MNQKLDDRCYELESLIEKKADAGDVVETFERLKVLKAKDSNWEAKALMQKSFKKRFNLLIHGVEKNIRFE